MLIIILAALLIVKARAPSFIIEEPPMRLLCYRALLLVDLVAAATLAVSIVAVLLAGEHVLQAEES